MNTCAGVMVLVGTSQMHCSACDNVVLCGDFGIIHSASVEGVVGNSLDSRCCGAIQTYKMVRHCRV